MLLINVGKQQKKKKKRNAERHNYSRQLLLKCTRRLGKLQREDRNTVRALCYRGDYEILRSGSRGFHFFEIRQGLFDSILN